MQKQYSFVSSLVISLMLMPLIKYSQQKDARIDSIIRVIPAVDSTLINKVSELEKEVARQKPGDSHFMVVGLATMGFVYTNNTTSLNGIKNTTGTNSLGDADRFEVSPMMLWRHGKRLLIEFEPSWNGSSLGVNWGDVSYFVKPGLIVRGGYLVLPFGIYNKRLAAGWINKLASDPVGIADYPPSSDFGVEVEGGLPLGGMKCTYDLSITNGMQLLKDGTIQNAGLVDNNLNKTFTGRVSILPFSNSSLELGVSGMYGKAGDDNTQHIKAVTSMYAFDLNFVHKVGPILVNCKAQYNQVNISKENFVNPIDSTKNYSFTNKTNSFFGQLSLRDFSAPGIFKNFELAGRYVQYITPAQSTWGATTHGYDVGIDYWLTWRSVIKFVFETRNIQNTAPVNLGGATGSSNYLNNYIIQYSVQF